MSEQKTKIILKNKAGDDVEIKHKRATTILSTRNPRDKRPFIMDIEFDSINDAIEFKWIVFFALVDRCFTIHYLESGQCVLLNNINPVKTYNRTIVRVYAETIKTTHLDREPQKTAVNFICESSPYSSENNIVELDYIRLKDIAKSSDLSKDRFDDSVERPFLMTIVIPYDTADNLFHRDVNYVEVINYESMTMDILHDVRITIGNASDGLYLKVQSTAVRRVHFTKIENLEL